MTTESMRPYPAYKDSGIEWIGEIPEGWDVVKLKHEFKFLDHKRVPLSAEVRGEMVKNYDYYGASGIIDKVEDYLFDETLILIGEDGANLLSRSTSLAFLAHGQYWVNNHAHILKPKSGNINYFVHLLETIEYVPYVTGSAQPKLTSEKLGNICIFVPPLSEQQSIAIFLDNQTAKIDTLIKNKQKQIELLKEERTAIINQAVTKGLNPDVPMRDSGIEWLGEIPEHWEIVHVKHLSKNESDVVQTGPFGAQLHSSDYIDEGIPLILIRNVNNLWIDDSNIPKVSEEDAKRLQIYRLKIGDIVFSRVGSLGRVALIKEREEGWIISGQMLRIRFNNPNIYELFALYIFSSDVVVEFVKFKSVGSTRDSINISTCFTRLLLLI